MNKGVGALLVMVFVTFLLLSGFSSCGNAQPRQKGDPSSLVMTACQACHDTLRICSNLGKKDRDAWNQTVTRMVGKGAAIDKESVSQVVDFLTSLRPGSQPVCK